MPSLVSRGSSFFMSCEPELATSDSQIYSVKWYRNNAEFYRFLVTSSASSQYISSQHRRHRSVRATPAVAIPDTAGITSSDQTQQVVSRRILVNSGSPASSQFFPQPEFNVLVSITSIQWTCLFSFSQLFHPTFPTKLFDLYQPNGIDMC